MSRRRGASIAAACLALALAACSRPEPVTEFPGGIPVPPGATGMREHIDDQFRSMMAYYRFELPAAQFPALAQALRCELGPLQTGPRPAEPGDPDWFAPRPAHSHRRCESIHDDWFYELEADVSRPDRYTVYLSASG